MRYLSFLITINTMVACEAFKPQTGVVDTATTGPNGYEPSSEPTSEPSSQPSNEPTNEPDSADTSDPDALDCEAEPTTEDSLPQIECASGRLWDGDELDETTVGGFNYFTKEHYASREWYCDTSFNGDYEGPERSYVFLHPGTGDCIIDLETRCADFDLIAIRVDVEANGCPAPEAYIGGANPCEMEATAGLGRDESLTLYENTTTTGAVVPYIIIVEAPNPTEEWFRLTVECD